MHLKLLIQRFSFSYIVLVFLKKEKLGREEKFEQKIFFFNEQSSAWREAGALS